MGFLSARRHSRGHLVLIGGGEDTRDEMAILRHLVSMSDAATVAVVPAASDYPEERADRYRQAFADIGVDEVTVVDARDPEEAEQPRLAETVRRADVIFFTGGDQVRLVKALAGSTLLRAVYESFAAGTVVAGTSAGAAAASDPMLFDGDGAGHRKGAVHLAPGFGFLPGITVDTHFVARGRIPRLVQALAAGSSGRGIGIAEDTAIVVSPQGTCEVVGFGVVTVLESDRSLSDYGDLPDEELVTVDGLRLGFLAPGSVFNLRSWRISQLPQSRRPQSPSTPGGAS